MDLIGGHLPELIILLVVILIIWGPGKLPDVGAAMGRGIREFRKASSETRESFRAAAAEEPATPAPAQPAPAQPAPAQPAPVAEPEPAQTPSGPSVSGPS